MCLHCKKGDKTATDDYWQLSLTAILCKITEGIVREKVENYFYQNNLLVKQQHGFVKKKSCTTNHLETVDYIQYSFYHGIPVDVVLSVFAKAFDTATKRDIFSLMVPIQ